MLFRYLKALWRHRKSPAKRYVEDGLGLERRAQYLSVFWSDHFSRSRAVQTRWAQTASGDTLTVLGAGPLFDFNGNALTPRFKRFRLVDANPAVQALWEQLNTPVEPLIIDITNCLSAWSHAVEACKAGWTETLKVVEQVGVAPIPAYVAAGDAILSLNVLSQLEVGWQESVERLLQKRFGSAFVLKHEQEWLKAARLGSQCLIEQHLASLEDSRANHILLITDVEYVDYTGRQYQPNRFEPPPASWSENHWTPDSGIEFEVIPALEGVTLTPDTLTRWLPSYYLDWHSTWLWHIAPHGTEAVPYGKIHRVAAFSLRYRSANSE